MKTHFYTEGNGIDYSLHRVRLDIPGVRSQKLELEASLSTTCPLWQRPRTPDCVNPMADERGWYFRLSDRIGEVLKGE